MKISGFSGHNISLQFDQILTAPAFSIVDTFQISTPNLILANQWPWLIPSYNFHIDIHLINNLKNYDIELRIKKTCRSGLEG